MLDVFFYLIQEFCHQVEEYYSLEESQTNCMLVPKKPTRVMWEYLSFLSIWLDFPWINMVVQIFLSIWRHFYSNNRIHLALIKELGHQTLLLVVENILKDPLEQERAWREKKAVN